MDRDALTLFAAAITAHGDACLKTDALAERAMLQGVSWEQVKLVTVPEADAGRVLLKHAIAAYTHLWAEFERVGDAS